MPSLISYGFLVKGKADINGSAKGGVYVLAQTDWEYPLRYIMFNLKPRHESTVYTTDNTLEPNIWKE